MEKHNLNLYSAKNDPTITFGQIKLNIESGQNCAKTIFSVVESLSANTHIGTNFMDKYVTSIHPTKRRLKPFS